MPVGSYYCNNNNTILSLEPLRTGFAFLSLSKLKGKKRTFTFLLPRGVVPVGWDTHSTMHFVVNRRSMQFGDTYSVTNICVLKYSEMTLNNVVIPSFYCHYPFFEICQDGHSASRTLEPLGRPSLNVADVVIGVVDVSTRHPTMTLWRYSGVFRRLNQPYQSIVCVCRQGGNSPK